MPPTLLLLVSFFCPLLTPRHRLSSHNFFPSHFSFLSSNLHHLYLLSFLFLWWVFFSCSIKMNSCYLSLNWGRSCLVRRALEIGTGLVIKRIFLFLTLKKKKFDIWVNMDSKMLSLRKPPHLRLLTLLTVLPAGKFLSHHQPLVMSQTRPLASVHSKCRRRPFLPFLCNNLLVDT